MYKQILTAMRNFFSMPFVETEYAHYDYRSFFDKVRTVISVLDILAPQGTRIALMGYNSLDWLVIFIASLLKGTTLVVIDPTLDKLSASQQINRSEATVLMIDRELFDLWGTDEQENVKTPLITHTLTLDLDMILYAGANPNRKGAMKAIIEIISSTPKSVSETIFKNMGELWDQYNRHIHKAEIAIIQYSSGTTGIPKPACVTYENVIALLGDLHTKIRLGPSITVYKKHLLFANNPILFALHPFMSGAEIRIKKVFFEYEPVTDEVVLTDTKTFYKLWYERVDSIFHTRVMSWVYRQRILRPLNLILIKCRLRKVFPRGLKEVIIMNNVLNLEIKRILQKIRFPVSSTYGLAECSVVGYNKYTNKDYHSVSRPLPNVAIKIDSENEEEIPGEILIDGKAVAQNYFEDVVLTETLFTEDGWLKTGDVGIIDNSNLVLLGRKASLIRDDFGMTFYPEGYECALDGLPYVKETLLVKGKRPNQILLLVRIEDTHPQIFNKSLDEVKVMFEHSRQAFNRYLPNFAKISKILIYPFEFDKNSTGRIKRYLYNVSA